MQFNQPHHPASVSHRRYFWLTAFILLVTAIIRLWNIQLASNVDEINVVARAVQFANGTMHLSWYNWPAQTLMRINGAIFWHVNAVTNILHGHWSNIVTTSAIATQWFTIAHITTVFFSLIGLLAVWNVVYLLTHSYAASTLGLWLLSISSLHVLHSRFATPDMLLTTLCVCSLWLGILFSRVHNQKSIRRLSLLSGALLGIAFATKYTGIIVLVPLLNGICVNIWRTRRPLRSIIGDLVAFLFAALILHTFFNPFFFQDFALVREAIRQESNPVRIGNGWDATASPFFQNIWYYLTGLQVWSGTWIAYIALLSMIVIPFFGRTLRATFLVIGFGLAYLVGISMLGLHWSRWGLPLTPVVAILASCGLWAMWKLIHRSLSKMPHAICIALITCVIAFISIPQLVISIMTVTAGTQHSTSLNTAQCIRDTFPAGAHIVADAYFFNALHDYGVDEIGVGAYDHSTAELRAEGVAGIVIAPKRLADAREHPEEYQYIADKQNELQSQATKICSVHPTDNDILNHKKDWGVYTYLWKHQHDADLFTVVPGDAYVVYDIR